MIVRALWEAQATSLQLPAACRQHPGIEIVFARRQNKPSISASCRDEQAGSLRSPERQQRMS
jgi:hypothetical protein